MLEGLSDLNPLILDMDLLLALLGSGFSVFQNFITMAQSSLLKW